MSHDDFIGEFYVLDHPAFHFEPGESKETTMPSPEEEIAVGIKNKPKEKPLQELIEMEEAPRRAYLESIGWDPNEWQHYREIHAVTFDEFWGDGSDHAMSWGIDPVHAQAEEAWDRSWNVQQENISGLQEKIKKLEKELQEEMHQNRTIVLPMLNWLVDNWTLGSKGYTEFEAALERAISGRHNFPAPLCLTCLDIGTVCSYCGFWPHARSCAVPEAQRIELCPDRCEASVTAEEKGAVQRNLLEHKLASRDALLRRILKADLGSTPFQEEIQRELGE